MILRFIVAAALLASIAVVDLGAHEDGAIRVRVVDGRNGRAVDNARLINANAIKGFVSYHPGE